MWRLKINQCVIAVISDIHGNLPALEAVLADIDSQDVDEIILAGDALNGGPSPRDILKIIYDREIRMVVGNHEQYILDTIDNPDPMFPPEWGTSHWTKWQISPEDIYFLRKLPVIIERDDVIIMHAAPSNLFRGYYLDTSYEETRAIWGHLQQKYVVTAHTHLPLIAHWEDKVIINTGSVGMPLNGSTLANYVILSHIDERFFIQQRNVAYDIDRTIQLAKESGFIDNNPGRKFAMGSLWQMKTGQPHLPLLTRQIQNLEATGLSRVEAIERAEIASPF